MIPTRHDAQNGRPLKTRSQKIVTASHPISGCSEQPLTGLDIGNPVDSFTIALVYSAPLSERLLVEGLQRALDNNPYFSGRLFGLGSSLPLVIPNNEGALVTIVSCDKKIPKFDTDHPLKSHLSNFTNPIAARHFDHHTPLLQIHLTNFFDGSILGISISHALCDGTSMIGFMRDWAAGMALQSPSAPPCWNRRDVQQLALGTGEHSSRESPILEMENSMEFAAHSVETEIFHLGASLLDQLTQKYGVADATLSRQDIATAFIFLLMVQCQAQPPESTSLTIVCDVRRVLQLPSNYLGNAVSLRHFELSAAQLDAADVKVIAKQIRHIYGGITTDGLRRDLAFWQRRVAEGSAQRFISLAIYLALQGGVLIDNMSKFDFYGLDFGVGTPVWIDTPPPDPAVIPRGVLMLPASPERRGITLHVTLPAMEMKVFRHSMRNFSSAHGAAQQ